MVHVNSLMVVLPILLYLAMWLTTVSLDPSYVPIPRVSFSGYKCNSIDTCIETYVLMYLPNVHVRICVVIRIITSHCHMVVTYTGL